MDRGEIPIEPGDSWFSSGLASWIIDGGRALNVRGGESLPNTIKLRMPLNADHGSQSARDKFRGQKGNTPDQPLRSLSSR